MKSFIKNRLREALESCINIKTNKEAINFVNQFNSDEELLRSGGLVIEKLNRLTFGVSVDNIKQTKKSLNEQMIDGQEMDEAIQTICNKLTVNSYQEVKRYVDNALKGFNDEMRVKILQRIHTPLENLRQQQKIIDDQKKTYGMTGDSMVDQATQYWHQIQSTLCELNSDFE
jgi:CRISPR/Cas system Type II protein with McrA/HNH and RuvC-like nuclease domain